jgi:transglutaminase-like putative cysteine protease
VAAGALGLAHVHAGAPGAVALPVSGVVLLAGAVAVGVAAPGLLPGYGSDAWLTAGSSDTSRGYQPIVDVSTRLRSPEERDVLRVRASQPVYLRLAGLDTFDGNTWRLGPAGAGVFRPDPARLFPADRPLPPEEPARRTRSVEADVEVLALENIYVPLPYQPVEVLGPIRSDMVWSTEGGFLASYDPGDLLRDPTVGLTSGEAYRVLAEQPDPTVEELRAVSVPPEILAATTALPRDYDALGTLAREVYASAEATTTIDRVLALQDWFVGPAGDFTYDLDVPALRGEDALTRFVLEDRVGYCEYFATAMAVMLRQTGIPARVAVGFLPGERVATADPDVGEPLDTYLVTSGDAHAWVEVLFPGYGWLTFEPTPRSDGAQLVPRTDELAPVTSEAERPADPAAEEPDVIEVPPDADDPTPNLPDATEGIDEAADAAAPTGGVGAGRVVLALTVVALLATVLAWAPLRRRRRDAVLTDDPRAAVLDAQRHLYRTATRLGRSRSPQETTPEVLTRWEQAGQVPPGTAGIAATVQAAAFGGEVTASQATAAVTTLERATAQLTQEPPPGMCSVPGWQAPSARAGRPGPCHRVVARTLTRPDHTRTVRSGTVVGGDEARDILGGSPARGDRKEDGGEDGDETEPGDHEVPRGWEEAERDDGGDAGDAEHHGKHALVRTGDTEPAPGAGRETRVLGGELALDLREDVLLVLGKRHGHRWPGRVLGLYPRAHARAPVEPPVGHLARHASGRAAGPIRTGTDSDVSGLRTAAHGPPDVR